MQEEDLVLADGIPDAVDVGCALDDAAVADIITGTLRVEVAVCIIDMDDDEALRRSAGHDCQKAEHCKQQSLHG